MPKPKVNKEIVIDTPKGQLVFKKQAEENKKTYMTDTIDGFSSVWQELASAQGGPRTGSLTRQQLDLASQMMVDTVIVTQA